MPGRLYLQLMELRACLPFAAGCPIPSITPCIRPTMPVFLWTWICMALGPLGYKIANPPLGLFNTHPFHPPTASPLLYSSGNGPGPYHREGLTRPVRSLLECLELKGAMEGKSNALTLQMQSCRAGPGHTAPQGQGQARNSGSPACYPVHSPLTPSCSC